MTRPPLHPVTGILGVSQIPQMVKLGELARTSPFKLLSLKFASEPCVRLVRDVLKKDLPFNLDHPFSVIMEFEAEQQETATKISTWLQNHVTTGIAQDALFLNEANAQQEIHEFEIGICDALATRREVTHYSTTIPVRELSSFITSLDRLPSQMKWNSDLYLFGHLGDGSLEVPLVGARGATKESFDKDSRALEASLVLLVEKAGGVVANRWNDGAKDSVEAEIYRAIKSAFDPSGLLNA